MRKELPQDTEDTILNRTKEWILKAVIGLNLCPFAKPTFQSNTIRYVVSKSKNTNDLLSDLKSELLFLKETNPKSTETSLLIHPYVLEDFLDQNDFLDEVDLLLNQLELEGIIQVANFHPEFQFAGKNKDDITNFVARSPYQTLHLLREDSISRIVDTHPDIDSIFKNNRIRLKELGFDGWKNLGLS